MHELKVDVSSHGTFEEIVGNIQYSLSIGLKEFQPAYAKHDGAAILVGSGPSVKSYVEEIRQEQLNNRPLIAVNGAHDFLMENGITPDLFVTADPRGMPQNFKRLNDTTIYMLASRCAPEDFKTLGGRQVVLWHSDSVGYENAELGARMRIGGGTTSGLRAVNLAYLMGFRHLVFYGFDSCLDENKAKRWNSGPMLDETKTIDVIVGGRSFICNMAMAQQAQDFQSIWEVMPDIHIESKGDGLITAILNQRESQGITNENFHRSRQETESSSSGISSLYSEKGI